MDLAKTNKKKTVFFDPRCKKDFDRLPRDTQRLFIVLFKFLENEGFLREPNGKKLEGHKNLYEIRLKKSDGNWRVFYAYVYENEIVLLNLINKKTQKTSLKDFKLIIKRLKNYE